MRFWGDYCYINEMQWMQYISNRDGEKALQTDSNRNGAFSVANDSA